MQIHIESPHIVIGRKKRAIIQRKLEHLGKKYDRIEYSDVIIRHENKNSQKLFCIAVKMKVPGTTLFASESAVTVEGVMDQLVNELEHQVTRHKEVIS